MDDLNKIINALYPVLRNTANKLLDNAWYAEDIVQDTLLELVLKIQAGSPIQDISKYCVGILKFKCRRALFKSKRYVPLLPDLASAYLQPVDPEDQDLLDALDQAMGELPATLKQMIELRYAEGVSPETIAKRFKMSTVTVWRKINKTKASLKRKLEYDGP